MTDTNSDFFRPAPVFPGPVPGTADSPSRAERPEPPETGELTTPDDLPPLHRRLLEQAAALPDGERPDFPARSALDDWTTAAVKVDLLWDIWRRRMHAADAHEPMREAANKAVHALAEALRSHDWREVNSKFDLASGWINHVKMQADHEPYQPIFPSLTPRSKRRGLRSLVLRRSR